MSKAFDLDGVRALPLPHDSHLGFALKKIRAVRHLVTIAALFQLPACQFKAPWMTLVPASLPAFSTVLVPVTVPFKVKLPLFNQVTPDWLVVM